MGQLLVFPLPLVSFGVVAWFSRYELILGECSHCYLLRVRRMAALEGKIVTTNQSRRLNRRRSKGFDVRVNGKKLYWMNLIPTECECDPK